MYFETQSINLKNESERKEIEIFLEKFNLKLDNDIDYTVVIRENEEVIATCSKAKSVFKCFAISEEHQGEGITNKLLTAINNKLFEEGVYHNFIFTKPELKDTFKGAGYKEIYTVDKVSLLENGIYDINRYLDKVIKKYEIDTKVEKSALVMNCNPFTLGHRYLIEEASNNSEEVIIFIVEEDKSLFPFNIRYDLVKKGVEDLKNVIVVPGGEYIISQATFPTYFIREESEVLKSYTRLDAGVFAKYFCDRLNIVKRYVGEEPYCKVTRAYNEALEEKLNEYGVELHIIKRKEEGSNAISASRVRELIREKRDDEIDKLLPQITKEFLHTEAGAKIKDKIIQSNTPH